MSDFLYCRDGVVKVWKQYSGLNESVSFAMTLSIQAHEKSVNCGCFVANSTTSFLTGGDDQVVYTWQIINRKEGVFVR